MSDPVFTVDAGTLHRHADFPSLHVQPRHVDVWCPPGYDADRVRFPVIYMHDGQNLFDPSLVGTHVDWGVEETLARLMQDHETPGAIVIGIWCTAQRYREYMPQKPFESVAEGLQAQFLRNAGGAPLSDAYLKFIVEELKPFVDATYLTKPGRDHTIVMGSSMGGLISLYGLSRFPEVFGRAGCLSTHWTIGGDLLVDEMARLLPPAGAHRLYFDYGTAGIDEPYEPFQCRFDRFVEAAGYRRDHDWLTCKFEGADHNEAAWRARLDVSMRFLLAGT